MGREDEAKAYGEGFEERWITNARGKRHLK
jgi:hypothetical protein